MLKNWLKGSGVGIMIMVSVSIIIFLTDAMIVLVLNIVPTHNLLTATMIVWFVVVIALSPYGSVPMASTASAFFARIVFVWLPITLGWFLFQKGMSLWFFSIGLYISSTCAGYNIVVTHARGNQSDVS